jgi:HSP20 family molecular chaperone IbpA
MMARISVFNSPFLVGFDHFERAIDRITKSQPDAYPPYNIEQMADNMVRITLAVAGFTMAQLSVQVEDNQLVIRGKQDDDEARVFLHRGIATRQFYRNFVLADGMEIGGAMLDNGLLHIDLYRQPAKVRIQEIEIKNHAGNAPKLPTIDVQK